MNRRRWDALSLALPGPRELRDPLGYYSELISGCRTPNQINRVNIVLTTHLAPVELGRFRAAFADSPPDFAGRLWLDSLSGMLPLERKLPREFERIGTDPNLTLYTNDSEPAAGKTLIVGFAGMAHRLMLPPAVLLDRLSPDRYDVVVLRDVSDSFFSLGIPGLGDTFFDAISNLRRHADPRAYRNTISLGTSGGAIPALLAALALGLNRGIAVGVVAFEQFNDVLRERGVPVEPFDALIASRPAPYPALRIVHGAEHAADTAAAAAFASLLPSELTAVPGCDTHGSLYWLLQRGRLKKFLEEILRQSLK
jgi:hypothetical protein